MLWVLAALAALAGMVVLATSAQAQSGRLDIPEQDRHVLQGSSVQINVTFGTDNEPDEERVTVTCEGCPLWERDVTFDDEKANCEVTDAFVGGDEGAESSDRVCRISFPEGFRQVDGGTPPSSAGEPQLPATYTVQLGENGEKDQETFGAHLSSASTCRSLEERAATGVAQRTDVLRFSVSGYPDGDEIRLVLRDGQEVFFEESVVSVGESITYYFRWKVPKDLPIDGQEREVDIIVDATSGGERETIVFRPGVAKPANIIREPGVFGARDTFERTEEVQAWTQFAFFAAPRDCEEVIWDSELTDVTAEQIGDDPPDVLVRRLNDQPTTRPTETVDTTSTEFTQNTFLVNYTIDKDERATDQNESDPVYDIKYERSQLDDGSFIGSYDTNDFEVVPHEIEPEYAVLQDEAERLETAELVLNLTYADGTPFTPDDADDPLEIAFGLEGEEPEYTFEANYRGDGVWNVSHPLDFEYEPLGAYTWRIQETQDTNGGPGEANRVPATVTPVVDVVSARPRLNMTTIVDDEIVNGTQRTDRVHVRVEAAFQNGVPLTDDNVDPSNGGLLLQVNKRNEFGRVVDEERIVMAHTGDPGTWVESFRIGREPSTAPVGEWGLRVEARDDRTPANENVTSFPFQVEPAELSVQGTESPPPLVNGSTVSYRFRLNYPDGSLVTERLVDESRGGELDVTLERVSRADQPAFVERELDPRPVSGGQAWEVTMETEDIIPGNHFFNVTGQDIHGNTIPPSSSSLFTVLFNGEFRNSTTPICPDDNTTDDGCAVQRGDTVYVVFPGASGDKGLDGDRPQIRVHRQDPDTGQWVLFRQDVWLSPQQFFNLTGRDVGENHVGRFVTDESTPADTYRLVVLGRTEDETGFAGFSQTFDVERVPVEREVLQPMPESAKKTETISARFENEPGDVIDTTIVDVGPIRARNVEIDQTGVGTFARWEPPAGFPTGPASMRIEGRDLFGNPFEVELGPVELEPVEIRVSLDGEVPDVARRGETATLPVQMTYETGRSFTADQGSPEVYVQDPQGNRVDEAEANPQVGFWEIEWTPRADLPSGEYQVVVTGTDDAGNVVNDLVTEPIQVTAGTVTGNVPDQPPGNLARGDRATATIAFPTTIADGQATVTTGSDELGDPQVQIDGSRVQLTFPTDRTTTLADAFFRFTGTDTVGNNLTAETDRFAVRAQQMDIEWVEQPPSQVTTTDTVEGAFVVEYPDGSLMRAGEGTAIAGLFARQQPQGQIDASPSEENPSVWEVSWQPPDDIRTDIDYRFSASARDQFRNEAPPVSSNAFFVSNPVVPDYVPAPAPGPAALLAALAGLAAIVRRQR